MPVTEIEPPLFVIWLSPPLSNVAPEAIVSAPFIAKSLVPFNANNPDYDLKIAGATGIICRIDDQPIYRQTFYTLNNNVQDTFVSHNNGDEIKDVLSAQKAMSGLKFNIKSDVTL